MSDVSTFGIGVLLLQLHNIAMGGESVRSDILLDFGCLFELQLCTVITAILSVLQARRLELVKGITATETEGIIHNNQKLFNPRTSTILYSQVVLCDDCVRRKAKRNRVNDHG